MVNPSGRTFYVTADRFVDDQGAYCGHCWTELKNRWGEPVVIDLMGDYYGAARNEERMAFYHPVSSLTRSVKQFHGQDIKAIARAARADRRLCEAIVERIEQAQLPDLDIREHLSSLPKGPSRR
jgi:hypothetical protein